MKLIEIHTCPMWEEPSGERRPGLEYEADHPPVVGWCNVLLVNICGSIEQLLAVYYD